MQMYYVGTDRTTWGRFAIDRKTGFAFPETWAAPVRKYIYTPFQGRYAGYDDDGTLTFLSNLPDDQCEFFYICPSNSRLGRGNLMTFLKREHLHFVNEDDHDGVRFVRKQSSVPLVGHDASCWG